MIIVLLWIKIPTQKTSLLPNFRIHTIMMLTLDFSFKIRANISSLLETYTILMTCICRSFQTFSAIFFVMFVRSDFFLIIRDKRVIFRMRVFVKGLVNKISSSVWILWIEDKICFQRVKTYVALSFMLVLIFISIFNKTQLSCQFLFLRNRYLPFFTFKLCVCIIKPFKILVKSLSNKEIFTSLWIRLTSPI